MITPDYIGFGNFSRFPVEEGPRMYNSSTRVLTIFSNSPEVYMVAQLLGALVGSALVYANYIHAIDIVEGGRHIRTLKTAGLFSTYAVSTYPPAACQCLISFPPVPTA